MDWDCNEIATVPGWEWTGGGLIARVGHEVFSEEQFEGPLYSLDDVKQFLIEKGHELKQNCGVLRFQVSSKPFDFRSIQYS